MTDRHLTPADLSRRLRRSVSTLANWRSRGEGPAYIPGRPVVYRLDDVIRWEKQRLRGGAG